MAKKFANIFGVIFVLVGLLGFFNNPIVGANGFFLANKTHDIAHLLIGVIILIMAAQGEKSAAASLNIFGVIYLLLAILGFVMTSPMLGLIAYNGADNILHLVLGVVMLAVGMSVKKGSSSMPMQQM